MSRFYRQGEVISVEGDNCEIELLLSGFCSGPYKCALTTFAKGIPPDRNRVRAKNTIGARLGEKVLVEVFSPGFYRALFFVFVLPLIALFLGCTFGIQIAAWMGVTHNKELYAGICAIAFFFLSLFISRFVDRRVRPQYIAHSRIDESLNCEGCSLMVR